LFNPSHCGSGQIQDGKMTEAKDTQSTDVNKAERHVQGSALLLAGRCVAIGLNLAVQVLTVRYFAKLDYGAFAFVFSIVSVAATAITLGMDKTLSRFAAIYHERRDLPRLYGTLALAGVSIFLLGLASVVGVVAACEIMGTDLLGNALTGGLLLVMIVLAPLSALDSVLVALFGVFRSPMSIIVRRHLVGPLLKLLAVLFVIATSDSVFWLAVGHVAAGGIGAGIGLLLLIRLLRRDKTLRPLPPCRWQIPARELLGHSLPLMSTDFVMLLRNSLVVIFLQFLLGSAAVAEYRAVAPLARLNEVVVTTLAVLFLPTASRLFAQRDGAGVHKLYWQTAASLAVLSFPIFAATFVLAEPLTTFLLGEQYRSSAIVLAILALGCYIHTSLGFNSQTLRVYGRVRAVVTTDVIASLAALCGYALVIPRYGPTGAALATAGALVLHNLLNQFWVVRCTDVKLLDRRYLATLASISAAVAALFGFQYWFAPHFVSSLAFTALLTLLVIHWNRDVLHLSDALPLLARVPGLQRLLCFPASQHERV